MTRWWDHPESPHFTGDESSRMVLWGWAGLKRDMALESLWWFQKPHDDAGVVECVYALRRSPKLWARVKLTSFRSEMNKNGAAICMKMWKKESNFSCLTVERTPSIRGVVSSMCTSVSQAWVAPGQTEVKPRTVHAISTKREKSFRSAGLARPTWGSGMWYSQTTPEEGKVGNIPGGCLVKQIDWLISQQFIAHWGKTNMNCFPLQCYL